MKIGVIGAGAISDIYLSNMINRFENTEVIAVAAAHLERAKIKADKYGIKALTVDELLSDPQIEMVVVLTPVGTHYELIKSALLAGKHVYTEKTVTDDLLKAHELLSLADENGLYLGSAPDTFLGSAWQNARFAIDSGILGDINSFSISANRDNDILTSMFSFLREPGAGILFDFGVYYMTTLVSLLGPVKSVAGKIAMPYPKHRNILKDSPEYGQEFDTPNESQVSAVICLENGITGTLHIDADSNCYDAAIYAIYGTKGVLYLSDPNEFGGKISFVENPKSWSVPEKIEVIDQYTLNADNSRGIGPSDMADAIANHRNCRASKEMACHVLEVLSSIMESSKNNTFVDIKSTCLRPEPLPPEA